VAVVDWSVSAFVIGIACFYVLGLWTSGSCYVGYISELCIFGVNGLFVTIGVIWYFVNFVSLVVCSCIL
jgi:hypothetical protein